MRNKLVIILILALGLLVAINLGKTNKIQNTSLSSSPQVQISNKVIFHGPRDKKVVALTFDADMTPKMKKDLETGKVASWYDKKIIDILKQNNVPATLFMSGMWIELYPNETKELAASPLFELANHSYSHPAFEKHCSSLNLIPDSKDEEEIAKTQKLLKEVAGVDNHFFRFPGGCYDKNDLEIVFKSGLEAIQWDVSSGDAFNNNSQRLISNVINHAEGGSIILMHMIDNRNAPKTAEALPTIISVLKSKGFSFVKVSELIR